MADDQYTSNRMSKWDINKDSSVPFNPTRSIQSVPAISLLPTNYIVPYSRYNSQPLSQSGLINERQTQQYQQPTFPPQTFEKFQPIQTNTVEARYEFLLVIIRINHLHF